MSIFTQPYSSWTHRLARLLVRPLVGTRITPNDLTTARLVTGIASCAAFARGDPTWDVWGGILWLLSCLLDRADGELARIGSTTSAWGHLYDYYCDVAVNGLFFLAIGIGLRNGDLDGWAIVLGLLAGISVAVASVWSEMYEQASDGNDKAYVGILGFDFDDLLYLLGPAAWFGLLPYILVGASVGAPIFAVLIRARLVRRRERTSV
jgi:phosphatidylglycerophosphate synthase